MDGKSFRVAMPSTSGPSGSTGSDSLVTPYLLSRSLSARYKRSHPPSMRYQCICRGNKAFSPRWKYISDETPVMLRSVSVAIKTGRILLGQLLQTPWTEESPLFSPDVSPQIQKSSSLGLAQFAS
ncbi:unnamed protein product [Arabis nemorensis]|uniref:Uncharacterized protein n=1 Tax=Arabis nemorensis TaxID=586526 RepID=A0A565AYY3_9BRAS|nr:unnamed protein product [Arabis nemorensis]